MFNPYEVMYDSTMDVYRYQGTKDEAGFDTSAEASNADTAFPGRIMPEPLFRMCSPATSYSVAWG